jgi:hypothetical protein
VPALLAGRTSSCWGCLAQIGRVINEVAGWSERTSDWSGVFDGRRSGGVADWPTMVIPWPPVIASKLPVPLPRSPVFEI